MTITKRNIFTIKDNLTETEINQWLTGIRWQEGGQVDSTGQWEIFMVADEVWILSVAEVRESTRVT